ncbi:hypothetical protein MACJ_002301 [Theileria orientalis]|uniref:Uncharacterized protein n=1 Tax=Theileria orientalis TaxID=68886 RepID=A0A976QVE5_THEOR|nr:hypothetical protein MACJ_002301 [Theileria orientalis]
MGGSYSDLNVYLRRNNDTPCKFNDGTVKFTKKNFPGCCNFVEFTHTISFTNGKSLNYNVLLYDGWSDNHKGNYVFGYYYPGDKNQVIEEVRSYYSVLAPSVPLVISFKCHNNVYNCYLERLKNAGWDRAYNISGYSLGNPLTKDVLDVEFKKLLLNRTIKFTTGQDNIDIAGTIQEIKGMNFRLIFLPKGNESVLGRDYLFSLDFNNKVPRLPEAPEKNNKNTIDPYFLTSVIGQYYDGIIVYFAREKPRLKAKPKPEPNSKQPEQKDYNGKALLFEFIDYRKNNICLRRKDKDGCWWCQEKVDSNDDKKLLDKLKEINDQLKQDVVTIILDKKEKYEGVSDVPSDDGGAYKKYTHKLNAANKPVLLFEMQEKNIVKFDDGFKTQNVDVYYLKAKGAKDEDEEPFLIVLDENGDTNKKKICHFKGNYGFKDWMEFKCEGQEKPNNQLCKKLQEKVGKIKTNGSCITDLSLLRWYAYEILIGQDPEIPKRKDETEATRPKEEIPPDQDEGLPIPWIIGGSVGGVVFVVSSAVGYGIYWYNTTIKLLT